MKGAKTSFLKDRDWLHGQYIEQNKTLQEIAAICDVTFAAVAYWMKKHQITRRDARKRQTRHIHSESYNDKDWLFDQYVNKRRTLHSLASECGVGVTTIHDRVKNFGLTRHKSGYRIDKEAQELLDDPVRLKHEYDESNNGVALATRYGICSRTVYNAMIRHDINRSFSSGSSTQEQELCDVLAEKGFVVEPSNRTLLGGKELDLVLPDHKIAIEVNGLYWHGELRQNDRYHLLNKNRLVSQCCPHYRIIHVFEDELLFQRDLVVRKIEHIAGVSDEPRIFARKTRVVTVGYHEKNEFLYKNHIQGSSASSINLGLVCEDGSLVAVMTFRKRGRDSVELSRYATSCRVVGGFQKLLCYAVKTHNFNNVITFADKRWSTGDVYKLSGFDHLYDTRPNYFYVKDKQRLSRQKFQKHKLGGVLDVFDVNKSEHENMLDNGYYRIYDCGHMKFSLDINTNKKLQGEEHNGEEHPRPT